MTVVPTTLPSHTSLFTGKYPHTHGTPQNGYTVNEKNVMLTEILKNAGFHTVGIIGSFALNSRFYFSQGFDHYNQDYEKYAGTNRRTQNERSAQAVTDAAVRYLGKRGIPPKLFLFVHYFDPHKPFEPPPPYDTLYTKVHYECPHTLSEKDWHASKEAARKYAGEISYMDHQVGRLIAYLRKKGILDNAILVVTSDHGENFWEHLPYFHHGTATYQTTMQSVCMIRLPNAAQGGTRIVQPISSIAIMPSLVNYLNLTVPDGIDGRAFDLANIHQTIGVRTLYGQATLTRPWKAPELSTGWQHANKARCIRTGNIKYLQTPYARSEELYDLARDPFEQENLLLSPAPESVPMANRETIERLKALGYM
jgi:arylsulfatase A-like enzyme